MVVVFLVEELKVISMVGLNMFMVNVFIIYNLMFEYEYLDVWLFINVIF